MNDKTLLIQKQNDEFRKNITKMPSLRNSGIQGQYVVTEGISSLDLAIQQAIFDKVCDFNIFTEDNDPHGEHDFGSFTCDGNKIFWKIDCYDTSYEYASEEPSDLDKTRRVLTVMLAEEY